MTFTYLFIGPFFPSLERRLGCLPMAEKCRKAAKAPDIELFPPGLFGQK